MLCNFLYILLHADYRLQSYRLGLQADWTIIILVVVYKTSCDVVLSRLPFKSTVNKLKSQL